MAFPIWGATAGQSPICAGPGSHGCPQFGRASLLPIDNEMDFARFMQIMPSASDALVAQPGLLWTLGIRDADEGMVVVQAPTTATRTTPTRRTPSTRWARPGRLRRHVPVLQLPVR